MKKKPQEPKKPYHMIATERIEIPRGLGEKIRKEILQEMMDDGVTKESAEDVISLLF